jgi:hypothetical protein
MEIKFFGQSLNINPGATASVIDNGKTIANISNLNDQLITILFVQKIDFKDDNVYKLVIDKDTKITINIQDQKKNSIIGSVQFELFGITSDQIQAYLENGLFSFRSKSKGISTYIAQKILMALFSNAVGNMSLNYYDEEIILTGSNYIQNPLRLLSLMRFLEPLLKTPKF